VSTAGGRPLQPPSKFTKQFWDAAARGEFLLQLCGRCGSHIFYPRQNCPTCGSDQLSWKPSCGRGTVYTFTVARRATHPMLADRVPYVIAMVELIEGPRVTTNIVGCDPDSVKIGMPVEVTFEQVDGTAVPVFQPCA
jgi:uncharacterized OB-fold protein